MRAIDLFGDKDSQYIRAYIDNLAETRDVIRLKHVTRGNEKSIKFIEEKGLLNLHTMLSYEESPMKKFLKERGLEVDFVNNLIYICGVKVHYNSKRNSNGLLNGEIKIGKDIISFNNILECSYLNRIINRFTNEKGEVEFFICGEYEDFLNYSCVRQCPEIIFDFANLAYGIMKDFKLKKIEVGMTIQNALTNFYKNICEEWGRIFNKTYLVTVYADVKNVYFVNDYKKANVIERIKSSDVTLDDYQSGIVLIEDCKYISRVEFEDVTDRVKPFKNIFY